MTVLTILTAPNDKLLKPATPVADVTKIQGLIDDLFETMYDTDDGIGLAATQVGSGEAVVVIDISENRDEPLVLVNPEIVSGEEKAKGEEGCLSVPGYYAEVERFTKVTVTALDRDGKKITITSDDFLAIAMQHEIDHLKGKLFIDYLSPLKKQVALKKVKKMIKNS
ncbi:peptide deformylase [Colwellia sp. MT41]|uniref:Peptide deformylase n=1 Tax=Colwellia marinimaniae TaxID=1513592 RepID=A0ABQ0MYW6_9GAMM|nr:MULTISPECIES: peptide deformylase [Colwellia]ALO33572.1 peptide deformylase [Colwellia sp. MT41]GAW97557.1 peptide deformylase 2 [Colwellia marinimaniae]